MRAYPPKTLLIGNLHIPVVITRRARAKRLTMRYNAIKQEVSVGAPARISNTDIGKFIAKHEQAMAQHISSLPTTTIISHHAVIPIWGEQHYVSPHTGHSDGFPHYVVMAPPGKVGKQCHRQLCMLLHEHTTNLIDRLFVHPDFCTVPRPVKITLRDPSSRWGSCGSNGHIMLSWRLALAPQFVADYVIIHELCHLKHHDHSRAFWQLCHSHCPRTKEAKEWLQQHGKSLTQYLVY